MILGTVEHIAHMCTFILLLRQDASWHRGRENRILGSDSSC
jgi:hypothetical protein